MHEMSYIAKIVRLATEAAEENKIHVVSTVEIEVGEMTGALPELLKKAYAEMIPYTPLEESELIIKSVPVTAVCDDCDTEYVPGKKNNYCCTSCGSKKSHIIAGRDVRLICITE